MTKLSPIAHLHDLLWILWMEVFSYDFSNQMLWFLRHQILQSSTDFIPAYNLLNVSVWSPTNTCFQSHSSWTFLSPTILSLLKSQPSFTEACTCKTKFCLHCWYLWGVHPNLAKITWNSSRRFRGIFFLSSDRPLALVLTFLILGESQCFFFYAAFKN